MLKIVFDNKLLCLAQDGGYLCARESRKHTMVQADRAQAVVNYRYLGNF